MRNDVGMLIDTKYVDDTIVYIKGDVTNLNRLQNAIDEFCRGLGAKIKWNKLVGVWISNKPVLNWAFDPNFRWLRRGEAIRYLGFKIGMEIDRSEHYNLLVNEINVKLIGWKQFKTILYMVYGIFCMLDNSAQADEIDKKVYQKFPIGRHGGKTWSCKGCLDHAYKRNK